MFFLYLYLLQKQIETIDLYFYKFLIFYLFLVLKTMINLNLVDNMNIYFKSTRNKIESKEKRNKENHLICVKILSLFVVNA